MFLCTKHAVPWNLSSTDIIAVLMGRERSIHPAGWPYKLSLRKILIGGSAGRLRAKSFSLNLFHTPRQADTRLPKILLSSSAQLKSLITGPFTQILALYPVFAFK
ncbi:hypothetical protein CC2G_000447 [Coprinopsis cinerea AmutBmut pab1-1]|nr:hypothetical protein CC2G_000447 [Coprinopsis cinerea AmutBmut pab1-1]